MGRGWASGSRVSIIQGSCVTVDGVLDPCPTDQPSLLNHVAVPLKPRPGGNWSIDGSGTARNRGPLLISSSMRVPWISHTLIRFPVATHGSTHGSSRINASGQSRHSQDPRPRLQWSSGTGASLCDSVDRESPLIPSSGRVPWISHTLKLLPGGKARSGLIRTFQWTLRSGGLRGSSWLRSLGQSHRVIVFRWSHESPPLASSTRVPWISHTLNRFPVATHGSR